MSTVFQEAIALQCDRLVTSRLHTCTHSTLPAGHPRNKQKLSSRRNSSLQDQTQISLQSHLQYATALALSQSINAHLCTHTGWWQYTCVCTTTQCPVGFAKMLCNGSSRMSAAQKLKQQQHTAEHTNSTPLPARTQHSIWVFDHLAESKHHNLQKGKHHQADSTRQAPSDDLHATPCTGASPCNAGCKVQCLSASLFLLCTPAYKTHGLTLLSLQTPSSADTAQ